MSVVIRLHFFHHLVYTVRFRTCDSCIFPSTGLILCTVSRRSSTDAAKPEMDCFRSLCADVVHFGEPIPEDIIDQSLEQAQKCDLMLICGTSASVYPFAGLPAEARIRKGVKIIEVNAGPTPLTQEGISDYLIQGKTGEILPLIASEVKRLML